MSRSPALPRCAVYGVLMVIIGLCRISWGQNDTNCLIVPDTVRFNPIDGDVVTVGKEVSALGGTFKFYLEIDTLYPAYASIRVILAIDRSASMCINPTDSVNGCCSNGDGSGNCMMNDPTNIRIEAAHRFVDSLAYRDPMSEVGVIAFDTRTTVNNPLPLNNVNNIMRIHSWIDAASCTVSTPLPAAQSLGKTTAVKATYLGLALEAGLLAVDYNFSGMPPSMSRHIIELTDGAWDDADPSLAAPDTIINRYKAQYPDRGVPMIHGIFLRNKELHTAHAYPEDGCSSTEPVVPVKLEYMTKLTGGLYFPASTPSTLVDNFTTMQDFIFQFVPRQLLSLKVTNADNNQTRISGTIRYPKNSAIAETTLPNLPLESGPNVVTFTWMTVLPETTDTTIVKMLIFRGTQSRDAPVTGPFRVRCEPVQSSIGHGAPLHVSVTNLPKTSGASFNLLGKKVGGTNPAQCTTPAGMYLNKSVANGSGKSKVVVK